MRCWGPEWKKRRQQQGWVYWAAANEWANTLKKWSDSGICRRKPWGDAPMMPHGMSFRNMLQSHLWVSHGHNLSRLTSRSVCRHHLQNHFDSSRQSSREPNSCMSHARLHRKKVGAGVCVSRVLTNTPLMFPSHLQSAMCWSSSHQAPFHWCKQMLCCSLSQGSSVPDTPQQCPPNHDCWFHLQDECQVCNGETRTGRLLSLARWKGTDSLIMGQKQMQDGSTQQPKGRRPNPLNLYSAVSLQSLRAQS